MSIRRVLLTTGLAVAATAACSSGPSEPLPSQQSVSDLPDLLSQDAIRQGYSEQGVIVGRAARAAKFGIEPSVVANKVGDGSLRYRAFVTVMALPARSGSSRTARAGRVRSRLPA